MSYAPITLFVYNRLEHTQKTVEALQKNNLAKESELFVFSDSPKNEDARENVEEVRKYIKTITGFKKVEIKENKENKGLANSIIAGVTDIVNRYGKVIVMEDDLVSSLYFLQFMNDALDFYENEEKVASIHGYLYPVKNKMPETFFVQHTSSWGWATWKRGWDLFEKDGQKLLNKLEERNLIEKFNVNGAYNFSGMLKRQIAGITDSWAIRWNASSLLNDKLNLYPRRSLIQNIGQDGSGAHRGNSNKHKIVLSESKIEVKSIPLSVNKKNVEAFEKFFRSLKPSIFEKIMFRIKKITPIAVKIRILNLWPNIQKEIKMIFGKMKGVNIIIPNPKIPNYYLFKDKFNADSTIIDVGCGFDADFSVYMIKRYGMRSIGIDPTWKHKESLVNLSKKTQGKFIHKLLAISATDGKITFNESEDNVSGSILKDHKNIKDNKVKTYEVESVSLGKLPDYIGLHEIQYIKLDIEGAEYELIDKVRKEDLEKYSQIFVEFHHHAIPRYSKQDTLKRVKKIESFGFRPFSIDNHNFLFYR